MSKKKAALAHEKPAMPNEKILVQLGAGIRARLLNDFDRYSNGHMIMSITHADVSLDGKKLGYIRGDAMAPGIVVAIFRPGKESGRTWYIDPEQLFNAVMEADEAREKELSAP